MSKFNQIVRASNTEIHKHRAMNYIKNLEIDSKNEYEVIVKPYKQSKSLEQLGYYWSSVINTVRLWQGLTTDQADHFLKAECLKPEFIEVLGVTYELRKSIAKMKIDEMRIYIDDCINFLGVHGQAVPPPIWNKL